MQQLPSQSDSWISPEERIEYYLNFQQSIELDLRKLNTLKERDYWTKKEVNYISYEEFKNTFTLWYCKHIMPLPFFREIRALPYYRDYRDLHSLIDFFKPFHHQNLGIQKTKYPLYYGEHGDTAELPIIRKTRIINGDEHSVVYDFRSFRFNTPCLTVQKKDINWSEKKHNVVWRGATTGKGTREEFVKRYFNSYNIAFSSVKQKPEYNSYKKAKVSIADQLQNKFIISLQGNDVASNLRWILSSNSVPIMPKPKWISWIMEDRLKPYEHYLELNDDLSNLDELLEWGATNDKQCQEIAENGKMYISQFISQDYDLSIRRNVLQEYAKRLHIIE